MDKKKIVAILLFLLIIYAWFTWYRLEVMKNIRIDFDEPVYSRAGVEIGECIYHGNLSCLMNYRYNYEHPMLGKIIYGLFIAGEKDLREAVEKARQVNIYLSTLTIPILYTIDPLASILVGGEALTTKYSCEAYLDSMATLFTLLAYIPLYRRYSWKRILLSSIFAGMALATKYIVVPALIPIPIYILLKTFFKTHRKGNKIVIIEEFSYKNILYLLLWITVLGIIFYISNPYIWSDPGKPLQETMLYRSIFFHQKYMVETSSKVEMPMYQQILWYLEGVVHKWNPSIILDTGYIIIILGYLGLPITLYRKPLFGGWLVSYTLFLLLWMVKWPQYTLLLTIPLSISASTLIVELSIWFKKIFHRVDALETHYKASLLMIALILFPLIPGAVSMEYSGYRYMGLENIVVGDNNILFTNNGNMIKFSREGLRITGWSIYGYQLIQPVKRGKVYATPYEWIPRGKVGWPGEIYYSRFQVFLINNTLIGYTRLERDAPDLELYKYIKWYNSSCLLIKYVLKNPTNHYIVVSSNPQWNKDWGFSIELTVSPPTNMDNVYQFIATSRNNYTLYKLHWVSIKFSHVSMFGLIDLDNSVKIYIVNLNNTIPVTIWFERNSQWVSIRLSYRKTVIHPYSSITYYTLWCVEKHGYMGISSGETSFRENIFFQYIVIAIVSYIYVIYRRIRVEA